MVAPHPTPLSRRQFLGTAAAAVGATALPTLPAQAAGTQPAAPKPPRNPFAYRFAIGDFEAWSISDGHSVFAMGST